MTRPSPVLALTILLCACGGGDSDDHPDAAGPGSGSDHGSGSGSAEACRAARAQLLGAVNTVATGDVTNLGSDGAATKMYVDASAGGISSASSNPWIFVDLAAHAKVSVTDTTSVSSTAWDLALKRAVLYTNDGDGGPGTGGAVLVAKAFADVTAADATGASFGEEAFFDAQCNANLDPAGSVLTTFSTWYDYNPATHLLTPAAGTWLVHGRTGALYKLAIGTFYATPTGSAGSGDGGTYELEVEAL